MSEPALRFDSITASGLNETERERERERELEKGREGDREREGGGTEKAEFEAVKVTKSSNPSIFIL